MKNVDRVKAVLVAAGFVIETHTFKNERKNKVRCTFRTFSRIHPDSTYMINLFCAPLKRAGFTIVRYSTRSLPMPTIIPVYSFDPVQLEKFTLIVMLTPVCLKANYLYWSNCL